MQVLGILGFRVSESKAYSPRFWGTYIGLRVWGCAQRA